MQNFVTPASIVTKIGELLQEYDMLDGGKFTVGEEEQKRIDARQAKVLETNFPVPFTRITDEVTKNINLSKEQRDFLRQSSTQTFATLPAAHCNTAMAVGVELFNFIFSTPDVESWSVKEYAVVMKLGNDLAIPTPSMVSTGRQVLFDCFLLLIISIIISELISMSEAGRLKFAEAVVEYASATFLEEELSPSSRTTH